MSNGSLPICTSWTGKPPRSAAGCGIQLDLISPLANTFFISDEPKMPEIKVKASMGDWIPGAKPGTMTLQPWANNKCQDIQFTWNVEVNFTGDARRDLGLARERQGGSQSL